MSTTAIQTLPPINTKIIEKASSHSPTTYSTKNKNRNSFISSQVVSDSLQFNMQASTSSQPNTRNTLQKRASSSTYDFVSGSPITPHLNINTPPSPIQPHQEQITIQPRFPEVPREDPVIKQKRQRQERIMRIAVAVLSIILLTTGVFGMYYVVTNDSKNSPGELSMITQPVYNPNRGFYTFTETYASKPSPLTLPLLTEYKSRNISLIFRLFYLDSFITTTNIPNEYLQSVNNDLMVIRQSGLRCILRFAYSSSGNFSVNSLDSEGLPSGLVEPQHEMVLKHVEALGPVLRDNSDVIAVVQAGFIGIFGEWYFTRVYGFSKSQDQADTLITDSHISKRREVVLTLANYLPPHVFIALRTPYWKIRLFSTNLGSLNSSTAYRNNSITSRIAHHNDCFLSTFPDDMGTYRPVKNSSGQFVDDLKYVQQESTYTPWGGETCQMNTAMQPDTKYWECDNALKSMGLLHATYLNSQYFPGILAIWQKQGCMNVVAESLGYSLVLRGEKLVRGVNGTSGAVTTGSSGYLRVSPGSLMSYSFNISNVGYASPHYPHKMYLLFVSTTATTKSTTSTSTVTSSTDLNNLICKADLSASLVPSFQLAFPTSKEGNTTEIDTYLQIPVNIPNGSYRMYLSFPPEFVSGNSSEVPEYNVVFTNRNVTGDKFVKNRWNAMNSGIEVTNDGSLDGNLTNGVNVYKVEC